MSGPKPAFGDSLEVHNCQPANSKLVATSAKREGGLGLHFEPLARKEARAVDLQGAAPTRRGPLISHSADAIYGGRLSRRVCAWSCAAISLAL